MATSERAQQVGRRVIPHGVGVGRGPKDHLVPARCHPLDRGPFPRDISQLDSFSISPRGYLTVLTENIMFCSILEGCSCLSFQDLGL